MRPKRGLVRTPCAIATAQGPGRPFRWLDWIDGGSGSEDQRGWLFRLGLGLGVAQRLHIPNISCHTSPMGNLTATFCMTVGALVGIVGLPFATSVANNAKFNGGEHFVRSKWI